MGHWTQARVGGGPWRRVWVSDEEEERERRSAKELEEFIINAYRRLTVDKEKTS